MPDLETRPGRSKSGPAIVNAWACALGAMLLLAPVAAALPSPMVHPNLDRGDQGTFHDFPFDRVNTFNGNLRIDIPIGQSYPLSERFSYRLKLAYNSNAWDFIESDDGTVTAQPMAHSNAGMGWNLSFGRLVPPAAPGNTLNRWLYVDGTGRASAFYDMLHPGDGALSITPRVHYSRDSNYLRLRRSSSTAVVEFPDGVTKTFTFDAAANDWRLTEWSDPFGNALTITYGAGLWTLSDTHGRTHRVYFTTDPAGFYPELVDRVEVAAFGGTTATYDLTYTTLSVDRPPVDTDATTPADATIPVLSSLVRPDGSAHSFEYGRHAALGGIIQMTLPTLGRIEWTYRDYRFQPSDCAGSLAPVLHGNRGIASRTTVGADGVAEGTWTTRVLFPGSETSAGCHIRRATDVFTPQGDRQRYWFTVAQEGTYAHAYALPLLADHGYATGQKLSHVVKDCEIDGSECENTHVLYRRFEQDADADPTAYDGMQRNRREAARRTSYRTDPRPNGGYHYADLDRYDFDGLGHYRRTVTGGSFGSADHLERFVDYDVSSGTYPDGGYSRPSPSEPWVLGTFRQIRVSDGGTEEVVDYCHDSATGARLRKRLRASPSAPTSRDAVVTYPRYADGNTADEYYYGGDVQTVQTSSDLCALALPSSNQYRIHHTYQYGVRAASWYVGSSVNFRSLDLDVDKNTGLPSARRDVAGMETTLSYDSMGRLTREQPEPGGGAQVRYGYRVATGSTRDTAKAIFVQDWTNDGSERLSRKISYFDGFDRRFLHREELDATRWTNRMRQYNAAGWLLAETEGGTAWGAELNTGNVKQYLDHDPFGQPGRILHSDGKEEIIERYGIRREVRTVQRGYYHDHTGVVEKDSVRETIRDRQGRLWKVKDTYYTDRDWDGAPTTDVTGYEYDLKGRRIKEVDLVTGEVRMRWSYDGRGFLVEEDKHLPRWGGTLDRLEIFHSGHDPLGNATTKVSSSPTPSGVQELEVEQVYDRAGRLVKVRDPDFPGAYTWRNYAYATENAVNSEGVVTDWNKGRLVKTVRHHINHSKEDPHYWNYWDNVQQRYSYSANGQVKRLETYIEGNLTGWSGLSYSQYYTYDDLGRVTRWEIESAQGDPGYTLDYTYDVSTLESLIGTNHLGDSTHEQWILSQQHDYDGLLSRAERGNGVVEGFEDDGTARARPGRVTLDGMERWDPAAGWVDYTWDSGAFEYDGRAALVRRGSDFFVPAKWERSSTTPARRPLHPCWQGFADPDDLRYIAWSNEFCTWREPTWVYDHSGRVISTRDGGPWTRSIRNLDGRVVWQLTPFTEKLGTKWYSGDYVVVYVYDDAGQRIGKVQRKMWDESFSDEVTHRHYHRDSPVITDWQGRWVNDPAR